jgi:hypothetical protein
LQKLQKNLLCPIDAEFAIRIIARLMKQHQKHFHHHVAANGGALALCAQAIGFAPRDRFAPRNVASDAQYERMT